MKTEMKTPLQELYEKLERTIKEQEGLMSIDEYESFKAGMEMSIAIIEQDGHFEKEKEAIVNAWMDDRYPLDKEWVKQCAEQYYNETFNTKEK